MLFVNVKADLFAGRMIEVLNFGSQRQAIYFHVDWCRRFVTLMQNFCALSVAELVSNEFLVVNQ